MPPTTPRIQVAPPGPKAQAILERDKAVISPSFVRWYPLVAETGEGTTLFDVDGNSIFCLEICF